MSLLRTIALATAAMSTAVLGGCALGGDRAPEDLDLSRYTAALIGSAVESAEGGSEYSLLTVRPDGSLDRFDLGRDDAELEVQGESLVLRSGRIVTRYGTDPVTERLGSFGDSGSGHLLGREDSTTVVRAGGKGTEVVEIGDTGVTTRAEIDGRPVASAVCGGTTAVLTGSDSSDDDGHLWTVREGRAEQLDAPIEPGILEGRTGDHPCIDGTMVLTERVHPDEGLEHGIRLRAIDTADGTVTERVVDSAGDGFLGWGEPRGAVGGGTGGAVVWLDQTGAFEQVPIDAIDGSPEPVAARMLDGEFTPDTVHGAWVDGTEAVIVHHAESVAQRDAGSPIPQLEFLDLADPATSTRLTVSEELSDFTFRGENALVLDAVRLP